MLRMARELAPLVGLNRALKTFHIGYNRRIIVVGNETRCIVNTPIFISSTKSS